MSEHEGPGARPARPRGAATIARFGLVGVSFVVALAGLYTLREKLMPAAPAARAPRAAEAATVEDAPTGEAREVPSQSVDASVEERAVAREILQLGGIDAGQLAVDEAPMPEGAAKPARAKTEMTRAAGGLSDEEVLDIVRTHEPGLAACYETELKQGRYRYGKMVLHFDITPRGQATRFAFEGDSLRSAKVRDCIVRRARDWRFPVFRGDPVRVAYPLSFRPA
jgi:hypothetical protein